MTIEIDGSQGEGGGQVLRTALTLSVCTGQPAIIKNIRAKRKKPGLMRQHLTAVQAAAEISSAEVTGDVVGSAKISFAPGKIKGGVYGFNIGTAGSCTLVLQTILLPLLLADEDSSIVLSGGTHNPMSPPFHFLQRAFLPLLQKMSVQVGLTLNRFGFYPAGGGEISVSIKGNCQLRPLHIDNRGGRVKAYAESFFANLPAHIAERELHIVQQKLRWSDGQLLMREIKRDQCIGPGNALLLTLEHEHVTEVFTGFAERGVAAEVVAKKAVGEAQAYLASGAAVGEHLADQLLLPMALAGGGSFTCARWGQHAATNAEVIQRFLPVGIRVEKSDDKAFKVQISPSQGG